MTGIEQSLTSVEPLLRDYGYAAVWIGVFCESFGLPLPGETLVIAGALLAARGDLHVVPLLAAVWSAAVLGDNLGYVIGHFAGRRLIVRHGARIGITEARFAKVEGVFDRFGAEVVLVARFFVLLRQLNGVAAGTLGMRWRRFLLYNAVGGALWAGAWGLGVYFVGQDMSRVLYWVHRFGYAAIAVAGLLVLGVIANRYLRRRRRP